MSLTTLGAEPQPSLAWTFESSNVDYVTNLQPSSTVQPGPAQLQGAAALVTNAPTSNTAVSFPGTSGAYMLLNSTPATFDLATSNLFVECWVYFTSLATSYQCIVADGPTGSGASQECWVVRINPSNQIDFNINSTAIKQATSTATVTTGTWYHISASYNSGTSTGYVFVNGGTPNSVTGATPKTSTGASFTLGAYPSPSSGIYMSGYIRDLRVVQGGVVPTASFTPAAAPFSYALPSYVTGSGSTVFTLLGQFITYVPGKFGQAIYFDNKNATSSGLANTSVAYYGSGVTSKGLNSNIMSYSVWIKPYYSFPTSGLAQNFLRLTDSQTAYELTINSGVDANQIFFYSSAGSGTTIKNGTNLVSQAWNHYSVVLSNVNMTASNTSASFYFNGNQVGATSNLVRSATSTMTAIVLAAGGIGDYNGGWCELDDLRIYPSALSSARVQSIYTQGGAPASSFRYVPQPTLAWSFEGTTTDYIGGVVPTYVSSARGSFLLRGQAVLTTTAPAGSNTAVYLNGTSGTYMGAFSYYGNLLTSNLFVEAWVYINSLTSSSNLINNGTNWSCGFTTSGNFQGQINGQTVTSSGTVSLSTWTHVAFSYAQLSTTSNVMYVFINGGAPTSASFSGVPTSTNQNLYVGWDQGANYSNFYVQDARFAGGLNNGSSAGRLMCPTTSFTPLTGPFPLDNTPPKYVSGTTNYSGSTLWSLQSQFDSTRYVPGKYGQAIYMNANAGADIGIPISLAANKPFSISVWMKTPDPYSSTYRTFMAISGSNYIAWAPPGWRSPTLEIYNNNTGTRYASLNIDTNWFHIVLSSDGTGNNVLAYFNGALSVETTAMTITDTFTTLYLVRGAGVCTIDDLRIYNTALSSAQVRSIYAAQGMPSRGVQNSQFIKSATGGDTVQTIGNYRVHTFTTVGTTTFTPATSGAVEVLVVAGGGSGGSRHSGGGGAGGLIYQTNYSVSAGAITVTVGDGGAARTDGTAGYGNQGSNSVFGGLTAIGGGAGTTGGGGSGGSGGGAWGTNNAGGTATAGQGNNGGLGSQGPYSNENTFAGGGGGGANATGGNSTSVAPVIAGSGGDGRQLSISGSPVYYAGGGGGGTTTSGGSGATGGSGGLGGGGAGGGQVNGLTNGIAGTNGTGGGGGAGGFSGGTNYSSGKGGSGIVIVRYPLPVQLTGTPLFTQLSPSAASSAVGAFSLRAVNGTSARAVQVLKYSPTDISSSPITISALGASVTYTNSPFATSYTDGCILSSTTLTCPTSGKLQFNAFSSNTFIEAWFYFPSSVTGYPSIFSRYASGSTSYQFYFNNSNSLVIQVADSAGNLIWYNSSIGSVTTGAWNHISMSFYPATSKMYVSINGSVSSATYTAFTDVYSGIVPLAITTLSGCYVSNFRVVVGAGTLPYIANFTPSSAPLALYPTGTTLALVQVPYKTQDFYADRLGNLLTAPVTGQTLQNWLGGATGYVSTWYDQSGKGNHATQATAANQPVIQKGTKGPGYSCLFNGTSTGFSYGSPSTFPTTYQLTIAGVVRRNSSAAMTIAGYGANDVYNYFAAGFSSSTSLEFHSRAGYYHMSYTIPAYSPSNEPLYYTTYTVNNSSTVNGYINAGYVAQGPWYYPGVTAGAPTIGNVAGFEYFSGEIYELLVFTQSMYDLDGTSSITQIYNNQLGSYGA